MLISLAGSACSRTGILLLLLLSGNSSQIVGLILSESQAFISRFIDSRWGTLTKKPVFRPKTILLPAESCLLAVYVEVTASRVSITLGVSTNIWKC